MFVWIPFWSFSWWVEGTECYLALFFFSVYNMNRICFLLFPCLITWKGMLFVMTVQSVPHKTVHLVWTWPFWLSLISLPLEAWFSQSKCPLVTEGFSSIILDLGFSKGDNTFSRLNPCNEKDSFTTFSSFLHQIMKVYWIRLVQENQSNAQIISDNKI